MGYFAKFAGNSGIEFMEGAEKKDIRDLVDMPIHIVDFGFIKGDNGEFAVLKIQESEGAFYFAPKVISDNLKEIAEDGMKGLLARTEVVIRMEHSKKGRDYFKLEYHENN